MNKQNCLFNFLFVEGVAKSKMAKSQIKAGGITTAAET